MTDRVVNIALMNSNGISCIDISADDAKFRIDIDMVLMKKLCKFLNYPEDDMVVLKTVLENGDEQLCEFMVEVEEQKRPICINGTDYSYEDYYKVYEKHNLGHNKTSLDESIEEDIYEKLKDQQKTIQELLCKIDVLEQKISNLDNKIFDLSGGNYGNNSCDY